ncbi:MAG: 47 kDa outer membrane protein [Syntrophomonadaceae bacterium]|nr:47 kDa outer membrane protein [Bacillota bacterium]
MGINTPFGSTIDWGNEWAGRYVLESISLRAVSIQPTVSYVYKKLGFGIGLVATNGAVELQRGIPIDAQNGQKSFANLQGNDWAYSFNAGLFYKHNDHWSVGISYRSQIDLQVKEGEVTYVVPSAAANNFPSGNQFSASLPLPQVASLGIGYSPNSQWKFSADVNFVGWSAYDTLAFEYSQTNSIVRNSKEARNYEDIFAYRVGAQYEPNDKLSLRAGISYGLSPVQDRYLAPDGPDADRVNYSAGVGYKFNKFVVDAAFLYGSFNQRSTTTDNPFPGTYNLRSLVPMISVGYQFN